MVTIFKWVSYGVYMSSFYPHGFTGSFSCALVSGDQAPTDFHVTAFVHHSDGILHIADWIILIGLGWWFQTCFKHFQTCFLHWWLNNHPYLPWFIPFFPPEEALQQAETSEKCILNDEGLMLLCGAKAWLRVDWRVEERESMWELRCQLDRLW